MMYISPIGKWIVTMKLLVEIKTVKLNVHTLNNIKYLKGV